MPLLTECPHLHTGSSSPSSVYMFVICMDCREILAESEIGKRLRESCPGWEREGYAGGCIHCHHDADYHIKCLTARLARSPETVSPEHI